jgi:hypothetical protein
MKIALLMTAIFTFYQNSFAQVNLVPNPSFEIYSQCPITLDQINRATGWTAYGYSPDYFNSCAMGSVAVPNNAWGQQYPLNGNGYAGLVTFDAQGNSIREFIGVQLQQFLNPGTKYFVSAYISRGNSFLTNGATNKFGFRFSTAVLSPVPIDNFSHIDSDSLITDSINWTRIAGAFIADSAYQYLTIGNFYDDGHTDTLEINGFTAYYYLDAICVSTDSLYDLLWTTTGSLTSRQFNIFPNPANSILHIYNLIASSYYTVTNVSGEKIMEGIINANSANIDVSVVPSGIYFLAIENKYYELIINHNY